MGIITVTAEADIEVNIDEHLDEASHHAILKQAIYNGFSLSDLYDT